MLYDIQTSTKNRDEAEQLIQLRSLLIWQSPFSLTHLKKSISFNSVKNVDLI